MIKQDEEQIWLYYQAIMEQKKSKMYPKAFCEAKNLCHKKFNNMLYRIFYKQSSEPELYKELVAHARAYMSGNMMMGKFCKLHGANRRLVAEAVTHLRYLEIIDKFKKQNGELTFVPLTPRKISPQLESLSIHQDVEIMEKRNDIELTVCKGVKVIASPDLPSEKLIKIIDLLKEL